MSVHNSLLGDMYYKKDIGRKFFLSSEEVSRSVSLNQETSITIRKTEAGIGRVTCEIISSSGVQIKATVIDNNDGTVTLKYTPTVPETYKLDVKFGGVLIPNGQITQEV
jgi:filamin